jgi:hypothetical protein
LPRLGLHRRRDRDLEANLAIAEIRLLDRDLVVRRRRDDADAESRSVGAAMAAATRRGRRGLREGARRGARGRGKRERRVSRRFIRARFSISSSAP